MRTKPMKISFLRVIRVAAPLCATAMLSAALFWGTASAEEWTKNYTVSGRANVHVDTNDGSVRVTTGDTKQVELRVIYNGYTLDKNLEIKSKQDGDRVELSARETMHWNWGIHVNRGLRLEVRMPMDESVWAYRSKWKASSATQRFMGR